MGELFTQWRHTRMLALTALCAALFAAVLIPFKFLPIIPGITELRPANALPVVFSLLFGPAAAWGAGIGNTLGDFAGTLGPGTFFGFLGNFLFGYIPYRLWIVFGGGEASPGANGKSGGGRWLWWGRFTVVTFAASAACALFIAWPVDVTGLAPFEILLPLIFVNNFAMAMLIAPPLLYWTQPRVLKLGLFYRDVLDPEDLRQPIAGRLGATLLLTGLVAAMASGMLDRWGFAPEWAPSSAMAAAPFLLLAVLGLLLI